MLNKLPIAKSSCCKEKEVPSCCCEKEKSSCCKDQTEESSLRKDYLIEVEFLYLDNEVCQRCMGTEEAIYEAVDEVKSIIKNSGYILSIQKIHIDSIEKAIQHKFISSPTIRINGHDISLHTQETKCQDCGDLCGCDVDCRVWNYNGKRYDALPKQLAIDAILGFIYGAKKSKTRAKPYVVPENIVKFFTSLDQSKHKK